VRLFTDLFFFSINLAWSVGKVHRFDLLVYRVFNAAFQTLIITLIFSLIVLWLFGIHSGAHFMRYWMFNWLSAMDFVMLIVFFSVNLGHLANIVLITFVILMLAGATLQVSLELSPRFYRYGYGLPLYHIINGGRHLLFGSYSRFALGVGVLLIYFGVLCVCALTSSIFWAKRQERKFAEANLAKTQGKQ
jgi:ABC-type polysaccharide/polyol phosphate export permease